MKSGYLSEIFVSFQGEGAQVGRRHLFVRLAGCNLRCGYCDTPDSLVRTNGYTVYDGAGEGTLHSNPVVPADLVRVVKRMLTIEAPIDALALTGGEPLTQSGFLAAFLGLARLPMPVLLETNGVLPRRLPEVLPFVDIISMDIKPPSNTGEGAFWDEHAEFLRLSRTKDVYVKILVDRGTTDDDIERCARLVASMRPIVPVFLQPIVDITGLPQLDPTRLAHFYALARLQLESVRVLPQTHKFLGMR